MIDSTGAIQSLSPYVYRNLLNEMKAKCPEYFQGPNDKEVKEWYLSRIEESVIAKDAYATVFHIGQLSSRDSSLVHNLASRFYAWGQRDEALKLNEEMLALRRRVLLPDHPDTLTSMNNLANCYAALNRPAEALKLREEALAARKRVLPPDHPDTLKSMDSLAASYVDLNRHAEALPLLKEVLAKADRPGIDRWFIQRRFELCLLCCQKLGDVVSCRASAEIWEKRNPTDAGAIYDAACGRAITASLQAKSKEPDATRLAKEDADKAMAWLTKAVAAGWTNVAHMKKDTDLDFLRDREDFKKLMAELEKHSGKK
jgi:tetratricopeptide (TPR) repeat protein